MIVGRIPFDPRSARAQRDRHLFWLEKFERMRAHGGWRPISIHADAETALRLGEFCADEVLRVGAANDD